MRFKLIISGFIGITVLISSSALTALAAESTEFSAWLGGLKSEAAGKGISEQTLAKALADVALLPRVVELDRRQPELTQTLPEYLKARVTRQRINKGQLMLKRYPTWLSRIEQQYGVQRNFIAALWGIETNYGDHSGGFPVVSALATLAFDGRRSDYFRTELFDVLWLLEEGRIKAYLLQGSWAGAMGQCQFMPSSFRRYAVNADGGLTDIWSSLPDVFASAANYLKQSGWQTGQGWGFEVTLPAGFDLSLAGLEKSTPMDRWNKLGVTRSHGGILPPSNLTASLILPDGPGGPAYLVHDNFRVLLKWNRSYAFAIAVGIIADRLGLE